MNTIIASLKPKDYKKISGKKIYYDILKQMEIFLKAKIYLVGLYSDFSLALQQKANFQFKEKLFNYSHTY